MYRITHKEDHKENYIELISSNKSSYAKIYINRGGSLNELSINNNLVIEDLSPLQYSDTYASSILFPFANRIKDGAYAFTDEAHQLEINQKEENNALHGFLYNKKFKVLSEEASENQASIILEYNEINKTKGFPFTYRTQLKYTLSKNTLTLNVSIKNTDNKSFPFTLGWHPYFTSKNLFDSSLNFKSQKKLVLDERMITTKIDDYQNEDNFEIKDQQLDDCFILDSNKVLFSTPSYNLEINSSAKESFLQIYTPPRANTIAIEPTTGVSNSFNNKIGLQVLEPSETYSIDWEVININ